MKPQTMVGLPKENVVIDGHGTRLSMISAVRSNATFKFIRPLVFQGSCDRNIFVCWLEYLLQGLQHPDILTKKYLLILDNASIHKGKVIDDLAAEYQTRIVYLPAYSLDLNPEKAQALLEVQRKTQWREHGRLKSGTWLLRTIEISHKL